MTTLIQQRKKHGLSVVDQRLASALHLLHIEQISRTETIADKVEQIIRSHIDEAVGAIVSSNGQGDSVFRAAALFREAFDNAIVETEKLLAKMVLAAHQGTGQCVVDSIPLNWFLLVRPDAPHVFEAETPKLFSINELEPVLRGNLSGAEKKRMALELLFPPPSRSFITAAIQSRDNTTGLPWQTRMRSLSSLFGDPVSLASQISFAYSRGENIRDLTERILPQVKGVLSSAKRIARTESRRIAMQVQQDDFGEIDDLMIGQQILAVMDENTRPEHAARNGTVFYKEPKAGQQSLADAPTLPDAPNCRCWYSPVLMPPKQVRDDPALAAKFENKSGNQIPDPSSYGDWFANADDKRRRLAVGSSRYQAIVDRFGPGYQPRWEEFIQPDGTLLARTTLESETDAKRLERMQKVQAAMTERAQLFRQVSQTGFLVN